MGKKKEPYKNPKGNIVDYFGFELKPGDIIVHGYRGRSYGEPFSCGVFVKENKSTLTIAKFGKKYNWKTRESKTVIKRTAIGKSLNLMQPVIIVSNPLFSLENPKIRNALEVIDTLKSQGVLPESFEAGITNAAEEAHGEE